MGARDERILQGCVRQYDEVMDVLVYPLPAEGVHWCMREYRWQGDRGLRA